MYSTLIIIVLCLIVYWKVRNQYLMRVNTKFKYKLYTLRDALRNLAVEKKVDCEDWQFKYLDSSISKSVNDLETLNMFVALVLHNRYKDDKNFEAHKIALEKGISENELYSIIFEEYGSLISDYVFRKHFIARYIVLLSIKMLIRKVTSKERKAKVEKIHWLQMLINFFRVAPETSTSYSFVRIH